MHGNQKSEDTETMQGGVEKAMNVVREISDHDILKQGQ